MRAPRFFALLLSLFALATALPVAGQAQPYGRGDDGVQPLDRLLPGIRREHPGNFYDAEGPTYGPQGDPHYHLKWMTPEGRVIWYDTDARSGRVLGQSRGRDSFDGPRPDAQRPDTQRGGDRPYGPYSRDPYDGGYGRNRDFERDRAGPPSGFDRPQFRDFGRGRGEGGGGFGRGNGEGRGRWRH